MIEAQLQSNSDRHVEYPAFHRNRWVVSAMTARCDPRVSDAGYNEGDLFVWVMEYSLPARSVMSPNHEILNAWNSHAG